MSPLCEYISQYMSHVAPLCEYFSYLSYVQHDLNSCICAHMEEFKSCCTYARIERIMLHLLTKYHTCVNTLVMLHHMKELCPIRQKITFTSDNDVRVNGTYACAIQMALL